MTTKSLYISRLFIAQDYEPLMEPIDEAPEDYDDYMWAVDAEKEKYAKR